MSASRMMMAVATVAQHWWRRGYEYATIDCLEGVKYISMSSYGEQTELEQIRKYIGAGHSIEAIREAGWGEWLDYFESKGVNLDDTQPGPALPDARPPVEEQAPAEKARAEAEPKFTMMLARHYLGTQVETEGLVSKREFVRMGPLITTGTFLFETGAVLGRAMRDRLATFAYPFCGTTPDDTELATFLRRRGQAIASAAPGASTVKELVGVGEMRKADPSLPAEQWSAWLLANGDGEVTVDFAEKMGMLFQSSGAGFGAEFPERFEELFANTYKVADPDLEARTKTDLTMFAEYCAQFYPGHVEKLGLSQYTSDAFSDLQQEGLASGER